MDDVRPFRIAVPDAALTDLRARLAATRWPERETVPDWSQGVPLAYLREFCAYWGEKYDWRAREATLNAFPQFTTTIDELDLHFYHVRSRHPAALPLLLTHGWPGSVAEFAKVLGPLAEDFHVVVPSLPGFGFSGKPTAPGWGVQRIADAWCALMSRLGYDRFVAHGGDWGAIITSRSACTSPMRLVMIAPQSPPCATNRS